MVSRFEGPNTASRPQCTSSPVCESNVAVDPLLSRKARSSSSVGRALPRHGRGHRFESCEDHGPRWPFGELTDLSGAYWLRLREKQAFCSAAVSAHLPADKP
jgi:hypothetical protein